MLNKRQSLTGVVEGIGEVRLVRRLGTRYLVWSVWVAQSARIKTSLRFSGVQAVALLLLRVFRAEVVF